MATEVAMEEVVMEAALDVAQHQAMEQTHFLE